MERTSDEARCSAMVPTWLHIVAIASLILGVVCAIVIAADVYKHPQHMGVMNIVWPITALFGTVVALSGYFSYGRLATRERAHAAMQRNEEMPSRKKTPFPIMVAKGTTHCGAGCALGDIVAEWLVFFAPVIAVWLGWHSVFRSRMFPTWIVDYVFAFGLGISFQYLTIKPMRKLSAGEGLRQAVKADALSLTAWQIGMYGFMAFATFYLYRVRFGVCLEVDTADFWFMMQLAMICGFVTSYPVNWWLLSKGIKETM